MEQRGLYHDWLRQFLVTDHVKHKKGFTLYKISSVVRDEFEYQRFRFENTPIPVSKGEYFALPLQVYPKKNPEASTKIVVWKRFNEFKILYRELKRRHEELRIGGDFPKFAKSSFFNRYSVSLYSKLELQSPIFRCVFFRRRFSEDVIKERKKSIAELLDFVAKCPPLFTANVFVNFFRVSSEEVNEIQSWFEVAPPIKRVLVSGRLSDIRVR